MRFYHPFLVAAAIIAVSGAARADGIKMLPPSDFSGNVCAGANTGVLQWDGANPIRCVPGFTGDKNGNVGIGTTTPQGTLDIKNASNTATIYLNGKLLHPVCSNRYANTATKIACGFTSQVKCQTGEFALSGGISGASNSVLQNSSAMIDDATGDPVGWNISVYDVFGSGTCTSNLYTTNGSVKSGNPPAFQINGGFMTGQAVATCCHF